MQQEKLLFDYAPIALRYHSYGVLSFDTVF